MINFSPVLSKKREAGVQVATTDGQTCATDDMVYMLQVKFDLRSFFI